MVFGNEWSNSDYGRGAENLREFFWRAWCWNGATGETILRSVHQGKRLSDDIAYQQDTIDADARAHALALRDAAKDGMSERRIKRMIEGIRAANDTKIDGKSRAEGLKKTLSKRRLSRSSRRSTAPTSRTCRRGTPSGAGRTPSAGSAASRRTPTPPGLRAPGRRGAQAGDADDRAAQGPRGLAAGAP